MQLHQMEHARNIEVNVISAESLLFPMGAIGKNVFVVVGTDSGEQKAMTTTNRHGGAYPAWNEKFSLPFPAGTSLVNVDVRCKTAVGEKTVGHSTIPVKDFFRVYSVPSEYVYFLSYRLIDKEGRRNGIINLSVKVMAWLPENFTRPFQMPFSLPGVPSAPPFEECGRVSASVRVRQPYASFYNK